MISSPMQLVQNAQNSWVSTLQNVNMYDFIAKYWCLQCFNGIEGISI